MNEIPDLPEWIKTLIEEAREEGEMRGRDAGERHAKAEMIRFLEGRRW
jgi:hypothetical protein